MRINCLNQRPQLVVLYWKTLCRPFPFFGLIFILALLSSCRNPAEESDTPHRIADYFVRYLAAEQQLKAYASFYEGDSLRAATPVRAAGEVTFQGLDMEKRELGEQGIRYTITRTSEYSQPFRFTHPDDSGRRTERIFEMAPLEDFSFDGDISLRQGATLLVKGAPLKNSESLVLLLTDPTDRAYSITLPGPNPENRFFISPEQLSGIPAGFNQLYIVKKKSEARESPDLTLLIGIEYYSETKQVEILP